MQSLRVEAFENFDAIPSEIKDWWRRAVSVESAPPSGSDTTDTPEWNAALARAFLPEGGAVLLAASDQSNRVAGVLPVYVKAKGLGGLFGDTISALMELHGGRNTVLADETNEELPGAILRSLDERFPRWSCLELRLVDGNRRSTRFLEAIEPLASAIERVALEPSPYIPLPCRFDEYLQTLKPNFRTEIRRGERRLKESGTLTHQLFAAPGDVDYLWECVARIERESWKESAGTSITANPFQERFYKEVLPRAAAAGELLSTVLFLDERPIAHQICLVRDGTAAIHKMSYVEDLKRFYPSTVLLAWYLQDLVERGIGCLDFMGRCEDFKMRWTSLSYGRTKHLIYRDSIGGRLAHTWRRVSKLRALVQGRASTSEPNLAGS